MNASQKEQCHTSEEQLVHRYGQLLTLSDLTDVLRYPSIQALRKARIRGRLPLELIQFPNRRGWFATARAVAALLERLDTTRGSFSATNETKEKMKT